jgi:hypothetical protein
MNYIYLLGGLMIYINFLRKKNKIKKKMLNIGGPPLSVEEVAKLLKVKCEFVDKCRRRYQLLAIKMGKCDYKYPAWQFTEEGLVGLKDVNEILQVKGYSDWGKLRFFVTPSFRLCNRTPMDVLKEGDSKSVLLAAWAFGEHGSE